MNTYLITLTAHGEHSQEWVSADTETEALSNYPANMVDSIEVI
jgi:hypothetical protein